LKPVDKFGCQMLGVGCAAAVSENQKFLAGGKTIADHICRFDNIVQVIFNAPALGGDAFLQDVQNNVFHFAAFFWFSILLISPEAS
jgi:hypothetical protein